MARIEYFVCDFCKRKNPEDGEFRNEIILSSHETEVNQRSWKVCVDCLNFTRDFCLKNQKNEIKS